MSDEINQIIQLLTRIETVLNTSPTLLETVFSNGAFWVALVSLGGILIHAKCDNIKAKKSNKKAMMDSIVHNVCDLRVKFTNLANRYFNTLRFKKLGEKKQYDKNVKIVHDMNSSFCSDFCYIVSNLLYEMKTLELRNCITLYYELKELIINYISDYSGNTINAELNNEPLDKYIDDHGKRLKEIVDKIDIVIENVSNYTRKKIL